MALRVSKAVLVFAIALFYMILVLNSITDYGSNYEFVRHVLMMDSTLPGNHLMWRAVNSPLVHTAFYIGMIAWESVTMLLCWWAGVRLLKSCRADRAQFAAALNVAVIALTTSLLMWFVALRALANLLSKVNSLSPNPRILIALYSPNALRETGLHMCPPEKRRDSDPDFS
jgi:predicted small integral membrane protein